MKKEEGKLDELAREHDSISVVETMPESPSRMGQANAQPALQGLDQVSASKRPPLKWAGGKRWLVPTLRPIWAAHSDRRLVEPFCGGLSVCLGLSPRRALLTTLMST